MTISVDEEVLRKYVSGVIIVFIVLGGGSWLIINNHARQQLSGTSGHTNHIYDLPSPQGYTAPASHADHDMSAMGM